MSGLVLADTSVFIEFLRNTGGYSLLEELIIEDRVILSEVVRLELLAGVRKTERFQLAKVLGPIRRRGYFPASASCEALLKRARGSGLFGGIPDILILADAIEERSAVASTDRKFVRLAEHLGIKVVNVG